MNVNKESMSISSKELILKYTSYLELFRGVADFGMADRKKSSLSFFGRTVQKIKCFFCLFLLPKSRSSLTKYIFQGYRYKKIIELFNRDDYSVIIGLSNLYTAIKNKQGFIWAGGVVAAFELALHLGDYKYLDKVISRLSLWDDGSNQIFLFLYEDTQPLGLVLSSVFNKSEGITTVCIAHAFFQENTKGLIYEGNNSNFNFVWSISQEKFFDKAKTSVIELGLPYEYSVINKVDKNNIVLVGNSGHETSLREHLITYAHMAFIYNILKENNFSVKFKPHPLDDVYYAKDFFGDDIATDLNQEMKRGAIFLGFTSSFLYEAKMHGLQVIGLDTDLLFRKRSFNPDVSFTSADYSSIPGYLNSLIIDNNKQIQPEGLSNRFYNALANIQNK